MLSKELFLTELFSRLKNDNVSNFKFITQGSDDIINNDISILNLGTRSVNCLRRQGVNNINDLFDYLKDNKLSKIRNLGRKSQAEIMSNLLYYSYVNMPIDRQENYLDDCIVRM